MSKFHNNLAFSLQVTVVLVKQLLPRTQGGRGVADLNLLLAKQIFNLRKYFLERADVSLLHKAVTLADKGYTPLNLSSPPNGPEKSKTEYIAQIMDTWKQKLCTGGTHMSSVLKMSTPYRRTIG